MFNVPSKILLLGILGMIAVGCSKPESKTIQPVRPTTPPSASRMVSMIDSLIDGNKYHQAIIMIDSLNKTYPRNVNARKTTLLSRAKAMEGLYRDSIPRMEAIVDMTDAEMDSLRGYLITKNGYMTDRSMADVDLSKSAGVLASIDNLKTPWTLTVSVPGNKNITGITLSTATQSLQIKAKDAASRRRQKGSKETMSFTYKEVNPLGEILEENPDQDATLIVEGANGDYAFTLTPTMQKALWRVFRYSYMHQLGVLARINLETYQNKLAVARDQILRFSQADSIP